MHPNGVFLIYTIRLNSLQVRTTTLVSMPQTMGNAQAAQQLSMHNLA